jgi:predicted Fe-Mo cluster-binding NifX family protein
MKIAISATGNDLDAMVDPRFGRCQCFVIVDTETLQVDVLDNSAIALGGGAGIQAAQAMAEKGVTHVLTGNCGPNAHKALSAACIDVVVDCAGRIRDVVARFKAGHFAPTRKPNVTDHYGTAADLPLADPIAQAAVTRRGGGGMGMGRGMGMGKGGGRGKGCGRGLGLGGGQGVLPAPADGPADADLLKRQAADLEQQLLQIKQDIAKLERQRRGQ